MVEKEEKSRTVTTELEKTQKALRMLNVGTRKLDQMISSNTSFGDHSDIGFTGKNSKSKTFFY